MVTMTDRQRRVAQDVNDGLRGVAERLRVYLAELGEVAERPAETAWSELAEALASVEVARDAVATLVKMGAEAGPLPEELDPSGLPDVAPPVALAPGLRVLQEQDGAVILEMRRTAAEPIGLALAPELLPELGRFVYAAWVRFGVRRAAQVKPKAKRAAR